MEKKERLYIVSFGDSNKFRVPFADSKDALEKSQKLVSLENKLNEYVREKLPMATATYFTNPVIVEIDDPDDRRFEDYPLLDAEAVESLKKRILEEVADMEDLRCLNQNAPWAETD